MRVEVERAAWLALAGRARLQYGVISQPQMEGFSRRQVERRVQRGYLILLAPGVWRVAGTPVSWRSRVMAACLAIGPPVAASHTSAARLWGLEGITPTDVHLVVPRGRNAHLENSQVVVHHGQLDGPDIVERHRLPVTTPARTIVDLAVVVPPDALGRAADDALRRRLVTLDDLRLERKGRVRRAGNPIIDQIIERREETGVGDSAWEDTVFGWIVDAGLPAPLRQHQVVISGSVAVLDMAYPDEMIAIEFDGYRWHGSRSRFDRDRVRLSELSAAGWRTIVITSTQSEAEVVNRVRRALWSSQASAARVPELHRAPAVGSKRQR